MTEPLIPPTPTSDDTPKTLVCEFCECRLSRRGQVLNRSPKATAMIDLDDDNAKLRKRITDQDAEIAALQAKLADATREPASARRRGIFQQE